VGRARGAGMSLARSGHPCDSVKLALTGEATSSAKAKTVIVQKAIAV
jgi:hypothetical protein